MRGTTTAAVPSKRPSLSPTLGRSSRTTGAYSVRQDLREPEGDADMKRRHDALIALRHNAYAHNKARPANMTPAQALAELTVLTIQAMDVPA